MCVSLCVYTIYIHTLYVHTHHTHSHTHSRVYVLCSPRTSGRCTGREWGKFQKFITHPEPRSWLLNTIVHEKKTRSSSEKCLMPGREPIRDLDNQAVLESKIGLKESEDMSNGPRSQLKGAPTGQIRNNPRVKIRNPRNRIDNPWSKMGKCESMLKY